MNPYDKINHLQTLQKLDPLRHIWESSSIKMLEDSYAKTISVLGLNREVLGNMNRLETYRQKFEEAHRWGLSGAVVPSTIASALALFETSKSLIVSFELPSSLQSAQQIFDAYQRTTTWLTPTLALNQTQDRWATLEKYRALAAVADPLHIYQESLKTVYRGSAWGLTPEIREMLDALEFIGRDIGSVAAEAGSSDGHVEDEDVSRLSGFLSGTGERATLSTENIMLVVRQAISSYQELSSGRDKQIFVTYIYPLILAIAFSLINPYADFVVKQRLESANKSSEKAVQKTARESGVPAHVIEKFRFVKAQRLDVHTNGRKRSPTVGVLRFGQPVEVLKKDGDWTLVHYSDPENDTVVQGWVLSRYLKRYN